jgi:hypothetical protein
MADPSVTKKQHEDWLDVVRAKMRKSEQSAATRSSLLRLGCSALQLHAAALAKDCVPRTDTGESKPLLVALTCYQTIAKGELR